MDVRVCVMVVPGASEEYVCVRSPGGRQDTRRRCGEPLLGGLLLR